MKYAKMKREGKYRGREYVSGSILPVSVDLLNSMILSGKASTSSEEEYKQYLEDTNNNLENIYVGMTMAELAKVDYTKLNKDPLTEFAIACGVEVDDENKKEIIELIVAKTNFGADE